MDNINDLIGDAAKQLMAQADGIQNQRLKESAQRVALTVSAKTRDETVSESEKCRVRQNPDMGFLLARNAKAANRSRSHLQLPVHDEQGRLARRISYEPFNRCERTGHDKSRGNAKGFAKAYLPRVRHEALERRSQARDVSRR